MIIERRTQLTLQEITMSIQFPEIKLNPSVARDIHADFAERASRGQQMADRVAKIVGSWPFILVQTVLLFVWIVLNVTGWVFQWDPYPFILMNLVLSTQAAFTAPIIMMSQNRQAAKDRLVSNHDFEVNLRAEQEIRMILEQIEAQNQALVEIHQTLTQYKEK
jgi:uncharacterized membrane protein